jgi:hypothetical protein
MAETNNMNNVVSLAESQLPNELKLRLRMNHFVSWSEEYTENLYKVIFTAMSLYLRKQASKDAGKVGLRMIDLKGNFIMGVILTYHEPDKAEEEETDDAKGNWSLEYTLDESDFADLKIVMDSHNNEFVQVFESQLWSMYAGRFAGDEFKQIMLSESLQTLIDFATKNCTEGNEFNLSVDGYFLITSAMEDGKIEVAIVPGAITKQAIKDDAIL